MSLEDKAVKEWMTYINPRASDVERERSRAILDTLLAKSISASNELRNIVDNMGFPLVGGLENIVGPPLTWLGNANGFNYMGSEKILPLEFITNRRNPNYEKHHVKQKIGRLLRQCYSKYLSPVIAKLEEKDKFMLDLSSDPSTIRDIFCSFKRTRNALQKGRLDNLVKSIMKNYKRLMCDLGFSMFVLLWDQSHMIKPEHQAFREVPLFHSTHIIPKDNPMFSSFDEEFKKDFGEDVEEQKFVDVLKKVARQCIMDSWNIATKPYEKVRCFKYGKGAEFLPMEEDIDIGDMDILEEGEGEHYTHFSKYFRMTQDQLNEYDSRKRANINCLIGFSIFQTVIIRTIVCHELNRVIPDNIRKSNVGLYLHAFSTTSCDLSFQLLCESSSVEEFTDVYLEQCGIYKILYPHGKRFTIAHDLVDMTNLLNNTSIWRDVKTGKANQISKLEHLFFTKMLPQKCNIRNVRRMISKDTGEHPIMTCLMKDIVAMTICGGYPICGERPSFPTQILMKQMYLAFATKPYSYFLDWVENNRRMIFSAGKEFFFYQLGFMPPIRELMIDTMMFERHETGIRHYLDQFRKTVDNVTTREAVNYIVGYQPDDMKELLGPKYLARRLIDIYPKSTSNDYFATHNNDMELRIELLAVGPNAVDKSDAEKLSNQTCFLNSICDKYDEAMLFLKDMGDESHKSQQDNYNKLVKKPFSDELATRTRTLIPQGISDEDKEKFIKETINDWNDALIVVWLEQEVMEGRLILSSNWDDWEKARPGSMAKLRTRKQKIRKANFLSYHAIKTMEWEWDKNNRRKRLLEQAFGDYFSELSNMKKMKRLGAKDVIIDKKAESFYQDIKLAAETSASRQDGWYDFMTWMRPLGISRFGRQMLKTLYFQYEKCEIPDNRFATYIKILFSIRPRDFQIIREFAACYENAPNIRIIHLGPTIAKNQLEALRKRFGLEPLEPPPADIGTSYYCSSCGNWADVKLSPESKGFKMYGIGLEDAMLDCLTNTLHCTRQGTTVCQGEEPLKTIDTIGVAVSIGDRKPVTRCATCGALTQYTEGNFTELGPTCGGHDTPEMTISKRPGNTSLKKNVISLNEVLAFNGLRNNRMFTGVDTRKPSISCYYCNKEISTRPERVKTIKLCHDPKPYDPTVAAFRSWVDCSVIGDIRFPLATRMSSLKQASELLYNEDCGCTSEVPESRMDQKRQREDTHNGYKKRQRIHREDVNIIPCHLHKNEDIPEDRSLWGIDRTFQPPDKKMLTSEATPKKNPLRPSPLFITVVLCDPCYKVARYWLNRVVIPTTDVFTKWMSNKMKKKHLARANSICSANAIQLPSIERNGGSKYITYK